MFEFVVLGLVSSVLSRETGRDERYVSEMTCLCRTGRKTLTRTTQSSCTHYTVQHRRFQATAEKKFLCASAFV